MIDQHLGGGNPEKGEQVTSRNGEYGERLVTIGQIPKVWFCRVCKSAVVWPTDPERLLGVGYAGEPQVLYWAALMGLGLGQVGLMAQNPGDLERRAEQGDADAAFRMGVEYAAGESGPANMGQALEWYRRAASEGNINAMYNLGVAYRNGLGVKRDDAEAVKWYRRAAEPGHPEARFALGVAYATGRGIKRDLSKAVYWFRKAEDRTADALTEVFLGEMYTNAEGVGKDDAEAMRWYGKAAAQGNVVAEYRMANGYLVGTGLKPNAAEAAAWFQKAAEQGASPAQYQLGVMYESGEGVEQSYALAYFWLALAVRSEPNAGAQEQMEEQRNQAAAHLTPAVVLATDERVKEWKEQGTGSRE